MTQPILAGLPRTRGDRPHAKENFNETSFKHGISVLDNIDVIVVHDSDEHARLLAVFKKHGITKLPDGRPVRKVIKMERE
ncbi:MAG: hypothetical protein OXF62_11485 [Caldilineaceae bacterium]|nr:hypothetical protein [Caldilineaceae bacterium]